MARGIHHLRTLFTPSLLAPLRGLGLRVLERSRLLQTPLMMRAAGLNAGAPELARGTTVPQLLARSAGRERLG